MWVVISCSADVVDLVLVGSDRTTSTGDVCNKIGTYLKALAARDNDVPFYVALAGEHHRLVARRWRATSRSRSAPPAELTHMTGRDRGRRARDGEGRARSEPGRQLRVRRDAGAIGDGPHHRARGLRGEPRGPTDASIPKSRTGG